VLLLKSSAYEMKMFFIIFTQGYCVFRASMVTYTIYIELNYD